MKKFIPIVVVSIVVLSGLGATALSVDTRQPASLTTPESFTTSVRFSEPVLSAVNGYTHVTVTGATTYLRDPNKPLVPIYVQTIEIPYLSTNIQVTAVPTGVSSMALTQEVIPVTVLPVGSAPSNQVVKDESVYGSAQLYPSSWSTSSLGAGRNAKGIQVTFVSVICYPVRTAPAEDRLDYATGFDIDIAYDAPTKTPQPTGDPFDMVVIAPAAFEDSLQPLIDHKNTKGVATYFMSMEDILSGYTGVDPPEQVKYYLKDALDTHNITYVLLVGGLKSHFNRVADKDATSYGSTGWHVPVRYVSIPQEEDEGCLDDLYFGCIYDADGNFSSWDSNHDGIYAAWGMFGVPRDYFDMYPEIFYGRLAVANEREVKNVVKKIITYETSAPRSEAWFKNVVGVGGKTFDIYEGKPDGEWLCDLAAEHLTGLIPDLVPVNCYATNRDSGGLTPVPKDIASSITKGASFVDFEGHGNPFSWNTIWHDGEYPQDWTGGINVFWFPFIMNGNKLPMVVVGGCHNALFNVTIMKGLMDKTGEDYFLYGVPVPYCFCWGLVGKAKGGAIGSTGCTGYGFGSTDNPNSLSAMLEMNFFYQIGQNNSQTLGQAHSGAIRQYINENAIAVIDAFCITNWQYFGDPSLKIGGY